MSSALPDGLAVACDLADSAAQMVALRFGRDNPLAGESEVAAAVELWWSDRPGAPLGDSPGRVRQLRLPA